MTAHSFPAGTFSPAPLPASFLRIVGAQTRMETSLILRHGEQLLLNIVVPLAILVGAAFVPFLGKNAASTKFFLWF